jgi:acetoacetate decarboxylase
MTVNGKLTKGDIGHVMPAHADPLGFATASFTEMDQLIFTYRTNTEAAAALLPTDLEIEESPLVSVVFATYGFSSVGPFREYIQYIHVRFRDEEYGYVPFIYITNERGMLAGREREGLPKLLGSVDMDMRNAIPEGLVTARLRRPSDTVLAQATFRPSEHIGEITAEDPTVGRLMGLRVFGSAVPGGPAVVSELVPSAMKYTAGELWSGDGSLAFTAASELSPVHRLPIVGEVEARAILNAKARLVRPTETYPLSS